LLLIIKMAKPYTHYGQSTHTLTKIKVK
jgi:hypothetical protein